jgi:hypothetical protein
MPPVSDLRWTRKCAVLCVSILCVCVCVSVHAQMHFASIHGEDKI